MRRGLVWLKKDLRVTDHRPLFEATKNCEEVIALYIYEPEWLHSYEFDESHLNFLNQSLKDLEQELARFNISLVTQAGSAVEVFRNIKRNHYDYDCVYTHQETGVAWTFYRDLQVVDFFRSQAIQYKEYYQFAVVRKLKNRDAWNSLRQQIIERKMIPNPRQLSRRSTVSSEGILDLRALNSRWNLSLKATTIKSPQRGGSREAVRTLESFLTLRGESYLSDISDPWHSQESSSRLSPYISFGNISLTQIHHALREKERQIQFSPRWRKSLSAFENRLWWHCHFIQKLESEFQIEFENVNRAFDGLRESEFNEEYFEAWKRGETGYPLIDATMRCLHQTGWINFRMRAMLVSFASYQLWLHWRRPAEYLARYFLDFEPGIHFSQFQMQSGVTGINTIRIYNPIKQAYDQRGAADFIRKFVPELSDIKDNGVCDPEAMPPFLLIETGVRLGDTYPRPIVANKEAYDLAKKRIFEWRQQESVRSLAKRVLEKHASRKSRFGIQRFPSRN